MIFLFASGTFRQPIPAWDYGCPVDAAANLLTTLAPIKLAIIESELESLRKWEFFKLLNVKAESDEGRGRLQVVL